MLRASTPAFNSHVMEKVMKSPFARLATMGRSHDAVHKNPFRQARFLRFMAIVDEVIAQRGECCILDVGGTNDYWLANEEMWAQKPVQITVLNLGADETSHPKLRPVTGNACHMQEFEDSSFDVAHSNSVIEHVGRWKDQKAMANEVRRVASRYYVQTPNMWFPIEPHCRMAFIHWMPLHVRISMLQRCPIGFYPKANSIDEAMASAEDACLLDFKQMQALFPDATIEREKFALMTKSLVAVR